MNTDELELLPDLNPLKAATNPPPTLERLFLLALEVNTDELEMLPDLNPLKAATNPPPTLERLFLLEAAETTEVVPPPQVLAQHLVPPTSTAA